MLNHQRRVYPKLQSELLWICLSLNVLFIQGPTKKKKNYACLICNALFFPSHVSYLNLPHPAKSFKNEDVWKYILGTERTSGPQNEAQPVSLVNVLVRITFLDPRRGYTSSCNNIHLVRENAFSRIWAEWLCFLSFCFPGRPQIWTAALSVLFIQFTWRSEQNLLSLV